MRINLNTSWMARRDFAGVRLRRRVAACSVLVAMLCATGSALAAGDVFTVGNYPVEATAANAVEAKARAIEDGQAAALRSVLKRLAPVTYFERLRQLKLPPAGELLQSVQVRSERNSPTEYIAEIDISFSADGVRRLLRQNGVPYVDRQAQNTTVVAVYRAPSGGARRYGQNAGQTLWREVWLGLDLENAVAPTVLEALKSTVHPDTVEMVVAGTGGGTRILSGEYGTERVVLAVIAPDPATKRIRLTIAGQDAVGPVRLVRDLRFDPNDFPYAVELAAVITQGILDGRWKSIQLGSAAAPPPASQANIAGPPAPGGWNTRSALPIRVVFGSIADWQRMRATLEQAPGVTNVDVNGLTPQAADVSVQYAGDGARLANVLAQYGMRLQRTQGGWILR